MEQQRKHTWVWIVLAVVIGLLLACGAGALAGGMAGYWAGQRAAVRVPRIERVAPCPLCPLQRSETPAPWAPVPQMPELAPAPGEQVAALILSVTAGSPAEKAGLQVDDLVIAVDGQNLSQTDALVERIQRRQPGDEVTLNVQRGAEQMDMAVTLGRNPKTAGDTPWLGVSYQLVPLTQQPPKNSPSTN